MPQLSVSFRPTQVGFILALLASTGFAAKAIFAKLAYRYGVDAVTMVTIRMLLSVVLLVGIRLWRTETGAPLTIPQKLWLIALGVVGYYLSSLLDFIGLQTVSASLERLILCLYPTLTVLISAALQRSRIPGRIWLVMLVTYLGIVLVLGPDLYHARADWFGVLCVALSATTFALYMSFSPRVIQAVGSMRFTELALGVSCLAIVAHFALTRPWSDLQQPAPVWGYGLLMALFSTVLPIYATSAAMQRIGGAKTALIGSFGPVLTIIFGLGILGEVLTPLQWLGAAVVLFGVSLVNKKD
ncbi:DMT family transporter [Chitinibacter sp. ZOR0017]|uniref:DMT family transporter n=1 Tax=Chitinibacter sp. ZOR0017 TaxID=1339254 RepID=UPI0006488155|nr:DMT family transporter [Chitinibacter sp. ZOR0017]